MRSILVATAALLAVKVAAINLGVVCLVSTIIMVSVGCWPRTKD